MSELEHEREELMERRAPDLPFGGTENQHVTGRAWLIFAVGVLLALGIPIMYAVIGLGGAALSSGGAGFFIAAVVAVLIAFVAACAYIYMRTARESVRRDDVGNKLRDYDTVRKLMKPHPTYCGTLDSIYDCAHLMYTHNLGFLVVLDENDRCVGVITDRDLVCAGIAQDLDMKSTPVTTLMERDFVALSPDQPLEDGLRLMQNEGVRRLPVIENGRCVGVLTLDDLVLSRQVSIDDIGIVLGKQLSEPNIDHGLNDEKKGENQAA